MACGSECCWQYEFCCDSRTCCRSDYVCINGGLCQARSVIPTNPMVCATTPSGSGHSAEAEALVYNFVKRKKPGLLLEMFGKERCRELEKRDVSLMPSFLLTLMVKHLYDRNSLLSMLEEARKHLPMAKKAPSDSPSEKKSSNIEEKKTDKAIKTSSALHKNSGTFPGRNKVKISPEVAVFNYFHERQQEEALALLFDEKTRTDYGKKVETMGIWMPSVRRMYAHYRYCGLKKENRLTLEIWKCELCKKDFKTHGRGRFLLSHIGCHEDIPCPCFIEGCDAVFRRPDSLTSHLREKHVLHVASLTSRQYHGLHQLTREYNGKAKAFRDKYFPPESFIGFSDCKTRGVARDFEDPKCRECGKLMKSYTCRRRHVAEHLKLSYKCVFEGCDHQHGDPSRLSDHYNHKHSAKVGDLSEEQLFKHKRIKLDFGKIMTKEVPNYFPYKNDVPEDLLLP
uniref:C2H2-type domain-containing protein n=1 Tax=Steinernema glaseri TaxID=37863 RepID=A0A1I7ZFF7_9BILA